MYARMVQVLHAGRIIKLTIGIPVFAVLMYGGFLFGKQVSGSAGVTALCTLVPLPFMVWFLYKQFSMGAALKKMQQTVGAQNDAEMDAFLSSALQLGEHYFFTREYVLNYSTLHVYPRKSVEKVSVSGAKGDSDEIRRPMYGLKIKVQGCPNDKMLFDSGSERLRAREELGG